MPESEPVLVFKRGEGWVYEKHTRHPVKGRNGKTYYLIDRKPKLGERWVWRGSLNAALVDMRRFDIEDFRPLDEYSLNTYSDSPFFFTLVDE